MLEHRFDASRPLPRHGKGFMDNAVFIEVEGAGQNLKSNGLLETVIDLRDRKRCFSGQILAEFPKTLFAKSLFHKALEIARLHLQLKNAQTTPTIMSDGDRREVTATN
jgi:hypothetical protein